MFETPGINFMNILCEAFSCVDPKVQKDTNNLTEFFQSFLVTKFNDIIL